jgi:hypothetical protein
MNKTNVTIRLRAPALTTQRFKKKKKSTYPRICTVAANTSLLPLVLCNLRLDSRFTTGGVATAAAVVATAAVAPALALPAAAVAGAALAQRTPNKRQTGAARDKMRRTAIYRENHEVRCRQATRGPSWQGNKVPANMFCGPDVHVGRRREFRKIKALIF